MTVIVTPRLKLRPPERSDAAALIRGLNNFAVSQWTGRIPYPYGPDDAEDFLDHHMAETPDELMLFITRENQLIGGIGIGFGEIGYWLAEEHWGQGYGREAARAMTDHGFETLRLEEVEASYQLGNAASRRILLGLGFVEAGEGRAYSKARQAEVAHMKLRLTRGAWKSAKERRQ